jgi:hypothetical protein
VRDPRAQAAVAGDHRVGRELHLGQYEVLGQEALGAGLQRRDLREAVGHGGRLVEQAVAARTLEQAAHARPHPQRVVGDQDTAAVVGGVGGHASVPPPRLDRRSGELAGPTAASARARVPMTVPVDLARSPVPSLFGLSVLVVAENIAVQRAARSVAFRLGLAVECAGGGRAAIASLRAHPVDARWSGLPIVALADPADTRRIGRCAEVGIDAWIDRAVEPAALAAALVARCDPTRAATRHLRAPDPSRPVPSGATA